MKPRLSLLLLGVWVAAASAPLARAQKTPVRPDPAVVEEMDEYASEDISDPLEPINRAIFKFNDGLYTYALRPISKGYVAVVPEAGREGIDNFFQNLMFPIRVVNCTLQGKFRRAGLETGKFAVNTVAGIGGFIRISDDVPALASIPREDTGQTLGVWHIGRGPYLVLPFFGPGTVRDTVGLVGDYVLSPTNWDIQQNVDWYRWKVVTGVNVVNGVQRLPGVLKTYDAVRKDALNPYIAVRSSYVQYREAAIKQ